jgi:hypothetical protein
LDVRVARSLLAVLLGFGFFLAIVRLLTAFTGNLEAGGALMNYLLLSVSWTVAAAVLGGYLTARLAGSHEFPHVAAVGLLMVVAGFVSMHQEGIAQPGWYQTTIAGCGPISAMIGAAIRLLTRRRQTENRNTSAPASRR